MDAYKIGVSIVLANGVSPVLAVIGKDLLGLKTSVSEIEGNFGAWKAALIGVGLILTGSTILGAMTKLVEMTDKYQDQLIRLQNLGGSIGRMAADGTMSKRAFDLSRSIPMKVEDLLEIPKELKSIVGDDEAMQLWEPMAKYAWLSKRMRGDHGGGDTNDLQALIKAGEQSGRIMGADGNIDPVKLKTFIDDMAKATAATGGLVSPQTVFGLAAQGGPSLRGLDEHGFLTLLVQSQVMGGRRAGTSYLSLWQQMSGAHLSKPIAEGLEKFGLLKPGEWTAVQNHAELNDEARERLMGLISKDPLNFADRINQELKKRGITDPADQFAAIDQILGRQTTQRFTAEEVIGYNQMRAEIARLQEALGVDDQSQNYRDKSISGARDAVADAWHNLGIAIGGPEGENLVAFLNKLTSAINWVTGAVNSLDPGTIDTAFKAVAGFAMGLMTIGTIILTALAITVIGPLVGGAVLLGGAIAAVVTAVATFIYLDWDRIKGWFSSLYDSVKSFAAIGWEGVKGVFNGIASAISSFIDSIVALYNRVKGFFHPSAPISPDAKKFNDNLDEANKNYVPMRFDSGADRPKAQPVSLSLNVDGRTLAQTVSAQLAELMMFPTGAGAPDHWGQWADADSNLSTT